MQKYFAWFMVLICCSGCAVVSKQYYYVPGAAHQTTKERTGYSKIIYSRVEIADSSGKHIGSMSTSNGMGVPLFMGPPYVPVVPIGIVSVFSKKLTQFEMDIAVTPDAGYFMALAVDSNGYKTIRDSLAARNIATGADLPATGCYMIVNGSRKIPLGVREYFMGQMNMHSYRMSAPVGFGRVRMLTIVTGNPLLDDRFKNLVFTRKKRITYTVLGLH